MNKTKEIFDRMANGETIDNQEFKEDFNKLEELVTQNPEIMQYATIEEVQGYLVIDEISDEDFNQMLINIAKNLENTQGKTEEDTEIILKMEREFLKVLLMERWTNRAEKSQ